jgi:CheY-like chemotaxis protein
MTDHRSNIDKSARIAQQTKLFRGFGRDFHVMLFPFNWKHPERLDSESVVIDVLVIEDNASDADLIAEFIKQSHYTCQVKIRTNAADALGFLHSYTRTPGKILLVLLDLSLPDENGFDLLRKIRGLSKFDGLPVSIVSNSTAPRDIAEALELEVASYIAKPQDAEQYQKLSNAFDELVFSMFDKRARSASQPPKHESDSTKGGSDSSPSSDNRLRIPL